MDDNFDTMRRTRARVPLSGPDAPRARGTAPPPTHRASVDAPASAAPPHADVRSHADGRAVTDEPRSSHANRSAVTDEPRSSRTDRRALTTDEPCPSHTDGVAAARTNDRSRRLGALWPYLPTFRVVAETQHLPTAARILGLSPSALSRTVALLEDAVGARLFERAHRQLRLNGAGHALLAAVRIAMRRVDDGIDDLAVTAARIRIAGPLPWIRTLVLPVADGILVELVDTPASSALTSALLDRAVDLVIADAIPPAADILVEPLGDIEWALCHPPRTDAALPLAISSESPGPALAEPRELGLRAVRLEAVLDACTAGHASAVLPVLLADERGLARQRRPILPRTPLVLARRASDDDSSHVVQLAAAIGRRAATVIR